VRKLVGLMLTRNSDWIIPFTLRAALKWNDEMVVLMHRCEDRTEAICQEIAAEHPGRVHLAKTEDGAWNEMWHREHTLRIAREIGATHCSIVDDDEWVTANLLQTVRDQILSLHPRQSYVLPMIPVWRSMTQYRTDPCVWTRAVVSLAFADGEGVSWTPAPDAYQHHRRFPTRIITEKRNRVREKRMAMRARRPTPIVEKPIEISGGCCHAQWADWNRVWFKQQIWYPCLELAQYPGRKTLPEIREMYSHAVNEDGLRLAPMPSEWIGPYKDIIHLAKPEGEPWQKADCRRMLKEFGRERFRGIDIAQFKERLCVA
jgi:hypothetical protein